MRFEPHPLFPGAFVAFDGKFSFMAIRQEDGWHTSWQDQENGGSASATIEGPFESLAKAESNCRHIAKSLRRKN